MSGRGLKIKKYFRLFVAFFRASFVADLEYRANFALRILTDIFWYVAQIITFETIFRHTKIVGAWNVEHTRVFLGILFVVDALYMILFSDNLDRLSERVRKGGAGFTFGKTSEFTVHHQLSTGLDSADQ